MNGFILSGEALLELDDIWSFIAQDNPEAADRWIAKLLDGCDALARHPQMGHTRTDLTDQPVLFWPVSDYLIIYRTHLEHIEVIAVTQGSRDIPSYLRNRR
ncbi:MAG TPA: type II toxin-antitoxin system RelE/ParE family toxin [Terracidiphilus sp.]|jgi:plasmid stabilization system protein ParE